MGIEVYLKLADDLVTYSRLHFKMNHFACHYETGWPVKNLT